MYNNVCIKETFEKKDRVIDELQANVSTLETRVAKLEEQDDKNLANERKDTLIMAGSVPPAGQGQNCRSIVRKQIREHLRRGLAIDDISMVHRFGVKPKTQGENMRNIMFKLYYREVKQDI